MVKTMSVVCRFEHSSGSSSRISFRHTGSASFMRGTQRGRGRCALPLKKGSITFCGCVLVVGLACLDFTVRGAFLSLVQQAALGGLGDRLGLFLLALPLVSILSLQEFPLDVAFGRSDGKLGLLPLTSLLALIASLHKVVLDGV